MIDEKKQNKNIAALTPPPTGAVEVLITTSKMGLMRRGGISSLLGSELNESLDVVVLQQGDAGAHVGDGPDVDHDETFDFGIFGVIESAVEIALVVAQIDAKVMRINISSGIVLLNY